MKIKKYIILFITYLAVIYPLGIAIYKTSWRLDISIINSLFPILGILAMCLLWLHSISGVFENWLRKNFDFDKFIKITANIIFISFVLHPILLLIRTNFSFNPIFKYNESIYIWLGIIGFILLLTYDIGKILKKKEFFTRNWNKILIISNVGFLLIFPHSLGIGRHFQSGHLKIIWIFYGITAFSSIIYTYFILPLKTKNQSEK